MSKNLPFGASKTKLRGSFSISKYFQTATFLAHNFLHKYKSIVFSIKYFLIGPQNSSLNLTKDQLAQNLKNG